MVLEQMGDTTSSGDSIINRLIIILSYDGSTEDMIINYTLLSLNFGVAASLLLLSETTQTSLRKWLHALASFLFFVLFQIVLCLEVHCVGISIIWCAIMGWILMDRRTPRVDIPIVLLSSQRDILLGMDIVVICYYALVSDSITTIAHILAIVVLGIPSYIWTNSEVFANSRRPSLPLVE